MNTQNQTARRYHWYSETVDDLVVEPHSGIATQVPAQTLNLTAKLSGKNKDLSVDLVSNGYQTLQKDIQIIRKHSNHLSQMVSIATHLPGEVTDGPAPSHLGGDTGETLTLLNLENTEFHHRPIEWERFWDSPYLAKILAKLADKKPENYEKLLATEGVGPKTIRALALVAEVIYGAKPSYEDPARYSFAHGGKDATPYPVDRPTYDQSIEILRQVVNKSHLSPLEKDKALRRLSRVTQ